MNFKPILLLLLIPGLFGSALGHTIDSVANDQYRIEIGWMNEPVVSGETNGIELYISPLIPCPEIPDGIKCAVSQKFKNGIGDLENTLKIQLVFQNEKITLPLIPDHNIPGKYYAFVNPTVSGYYQANILGNIGESIVSLSMHPPKVEERSWIEFPEPSDITLYQLIDGHTALLDDIGNLKNSVSKLEKEKQQTSIGYVGIGLGIIGISIAFIALNKTKKR